MIPETDLHCDCLLALASWRRGVQGERASSEANGAIASFCVCTQQVRTAASHPTGDLPPSLPLGWLYTAGPGRLRSVRFQVGPVLRQPARIDSCYVRLRTHAQPKPLAVDMRRHNDRSRVSQLCHHRAPINVGLGYRDNSDDCWTHLACHRSARCRRSRVPAA